MFQIGQVVRYVGGPISTLVQWEVAPSPVSGGPTIKEIESDPCIQPGDLAIVTEASYYERSSFTVKVVFPNVPAEFDLEHSDLELVSQGEGMIVPLVDSTDDIELMFEALRVIGKRIALLSPDDPRLT